MVDLIIWNYVNKNNNLIPHFNNTIYCNSKKEIIERLKNIKSPTLVLDNDYITYSRTSVINCVNTLKSYNGATVVLLTPYQLKCAQLYEKNIISNYKLYTIDNFSFDDIKFHGELYFPSIKDYIDKNDYIPTVALIPPILNYNFEKVTNLKQFSLNNTCCNSTNVTKNQNSISYVLIVMLLLIILVIIFWLYVQFN